eukprot:3196975-Rhodomonas_salina.1
MNTWISLLGTSTSSRQREAGRVLGTTATTTTTTTTTTARVSDPELCPGTRVPGDPGMHRLSRMKVEFRVPVLAVLAGLIEGNLSKVDKKEAFPGESAQKAGAEKDKQPTSFLTRPMHIGIPRIPRYQLSWRVQSPIPARVPGYPGYPGMIEIPTSTLVREICQCPQNLGVRLRGPPALGTTSTTSSTTTSTTPSNQIRENAFLRPRTVQLVLELRLLRLVFDFAMYRDPGTRVPAVPGVVGIPSRPWTGARAGTLRHQSGGAALAFPTASGYAFWLS